MEPVVEMCLDRWFTPSFSNSEAARRVGEIVRRTTPSGYRGGVAAMSAFDVTEQLVEIDCPTLVLPAELDQGTPVSCSGDHCRTYSGRAPGGHCIRATYCCRRTTGRL